MEKQRHLSVIPDVTPSGPTMAEVNMSEVLQQELIKNLYFMIESQDPDISNEGAAILSECIGMYQKSVHFKEVIAHAFERSADYNPALEVPDIYR